MKAAVQEGNSPQGAAASRKNRIRNMTRPGGRGLGRGSGRSHCDGSGHSPVTNISLKEPQHANDRQLRSISRTFGSEESRTSASSSSVSQLPAAAASGRPTVLLQSWPLSPHWTEVVERNIPSTGLRRGIVSIPTCGASLSTARPPLIDCLLTPERVSKAVTHRVGLCPAGGGGVTWSYQMVPEVRGLRVGG